MTDHKTGDDPEHKVCVNTRLARHDADDVYYPSCACGWTGKKRRAGRTPDVQWNAAWDEANAHLLKPETMT